MHLGCLVCALMLLTGFQNTPYVHDDAGEFIPIDIVMVLDVSRSMITADPNRIANTAMNMFINKLEPERDRVGVVAYAGRVTYSRGLYTICEDHLPNLQQDIINLEYASWTDHPLGILEAIRILQADYCNYGVRQPLIIFLTDGNLNVVPYAVRTTEDAKEDKLYAIALAQKYGFPIYSIGLNVDGQLDRRYTEVIAQETGGIAFEAVSASELPDILDKIFSLMILAQQHMEEHEYVQAYQDYTVSIQALPYAAYEESPYLAYIQQDEASDIQRSFFTVFAIVTVIIFFITVIYFMMRPRRVFTGRVVIDVMDTTVQQHVLPLNKNLIEYGNHATLENLFGKDICTKFNSITLLPAPNAPSHAPQLIIKCKNKHVKFWKDFNEYNYSSIHEIAINAGAELRIFADDEPKEVRLKYVV